MGRKTVCRMSNLYVVSHPHQEPSYFYKRSGKVHVPWNTSKGHKRKFVCRGGEYLKKKVLYKGNLHFWGEYEPPSEAQIMGSARPRAIHNPLFPVRGTVPVPLNARNTDPYVFGNHFKHICCGMRGRDYESGDVILFGHIEKEGTNYILSLETVFVVDCKVEIDYSRNTTQYFKAAIGPLVHMKKKFYYQGVKYDKTKNYFSFVPCQLEYSTKDHPKINLTRYGFIPQNNKGYPWRVNSVPFTCKHWKKIIQDVLKSGWLIGTHIDAI